MKWSYIFLFILAVAASTGRYVWSPFPPGTENPLVALMALNAPMLLWVIHGWYAAMPGTVVFIGGTLVLGVWWVLVQTGRGRGDNGIWRIAKRNGILYLPDVDSKATSLILHWHFRFRLRCRDRVAILGELGLSIAHSTVVCSVLCYADTYEKLWHRVGQPLALRSMPRSKPRTPASVCPPERPLLAGYDRGRGANMEL